MASSQTRRSRNRRRQDRFKPSQVRLERMIHAGYIKEGDILSVNLDDGIHDFTIIGQRKITLRRSNGEIISLSRGGGPFSILVAAGLAVPAHVKRGTWDFFLVYRGGHNLGTLNQIRHQFWNNSERNRLWCAGRARQAAATS